MTQPFKAIVWDLDGTLIDSAADIAYSLNLLLVEDGLVPHSLADIALMVGNGVAKLLERGYEAASAPLTDGNRPVVLKRFMDVYAANATRETAPYPGVEDVLRRYQSEGVVQGICTNKPEGITRKILKDLDLDKYFSSVIGGDTCSINKPDPIPLMTCLTELGVAKEEAVMIGDSGVDARTAQAAGIPCILVSFGYLHEPIENLNANAVIDHFSTLPDALNSLKETTL